MINGMVDKINEWESGEMDAETEVEFFAELVKTRIAWTLQGMYGRYAARLIEGGYISKTGDVLKYPDGE